MEDQKVDTSDHAEASSDKTASQTVRAGDQARGGIAAQPGDPTSPKQAAERSRALNEKMADAGFGDHKDEEFGRDGTESSSETAKL